MSTANHLRTFESYFFSPGTDLGLLLTYVVDPKWQSFLEIRRGSCNTGAVAISWLDRRSSSNKDGKTAYAKRVCHFQNRRTNARSSAMAMGPKGLNETIPGERTQRQSHYFLLLHSLVFTVQARCCPCSSCFLAPSPAFTHQSTVIRNGKAEWENAAELGWSNGRRRLRLRRHTAWGRVPACWIY